MTMVQNQLLGSLNGTVAALPQRTRGRYASDHTSSWNVHESWSEQLQSSTAPHFFHKRARNIGCKMLQGSMKWIILMGVGSYHVISSHPAAFPLPKTNIEVPHQKMSRILFLLGQTGQLWKRHHRDIQTTMNLNHCRPLANGTFINPTDPWSQMMSRLKLPGIGENKPNWYPPQQLFCTEARLQNQQAAAKSIFGLRI